MSKEIFDVNVMCVAPECENVVFSTQYNYSTKGFEKDNEFFDFDSRLLESDILCDKCSKEKNNDEENR